MTYKSKLSHPDLCVTRRQAVIRPRESIHYVGLSPPLSLGTYAGDINTMESALLERMYYCKVGDGFEAAPKVELAIPERKLGWFRDQVLVRGSTFAPVSLDDFVEMYKGPKKALYARAVQSLRQHPVRRRDAESNSFVKREKCNVSKAPRCIQPRDPRYNASLGKYIKPIEHKLYGRVRCGASGTLVISKGLNLDGTGQLIARKWQHFARPVAIGLDATKFDMHVSEAMLVWEHSVYKALYAGDPFLTKLLAWQVDNRGKSFMPDGKLKYSVRGKRFSGDMNTALGNCLIMCAMVFTYARERGVEIDLVNNGDDCVVFLEEESLPEFSRGLDAWFLELGFRMTVEEPVRVLEQIEFCQMKPVVGPAGTYRMVRSPKVAFQKDTMCVRTLDDEGYRSWFAGVGSCGRVCCDGIPIMGALYQSIVDNTRGAYSEALIEDSGMVHASRGMGDKRSSVSEESRYSFWLAFGVSPDTQRGVEQACASTQYRFCPSPLYPTHWPFETKPITIKRTPPSFK